MDLQQRVKAVVDYYKLSNRAFAIKCGISQPTFDKQIRGLREISTEVITATLSSFPEISAEWLLRGEGEMIKGETSSKEMERIGKLNDVIDSLQEVINMKNDVIAELNERIKQLENQIKTK